MYPHKPLDTKDERYMNYSLSPVAPPFKNILHLNFYNNKLFVPASKFSRILNDTPSNSINCEAFKPQNDTPTAQYVFKGLSLDMTSIDKATTLPSTINHSNVMKSKYKASFIQYMNDSTMKSIWYLLHIYI